MMNLLKVLLIGFGLCAVITSIHAQDITDPRAVKPPARMELDQKTRSMLDRSQRVAEEDAEGRRYLPQNHRHVLLARIGVDGKVEMFCADNIHAAENWVATSQLERQP